MNLSHKQNFFPGFKSPIPSPMIKDMYTSWNHIWLFIYSNEVEKSVYICFTNGLIFIWVLKEIMMITISLPQLCDWSWNQNWKHTNYVLVNHDFARPFKSKFPFFFLSLSLCFLYNFELSLAPVVNHCDFYGFNQSKCVRRTVRAGHWNEIQPNSRFYASSEPRWLSIGRLISLK